MATMSSEQVLETVSEAREAGRRADLSYANLTGADLSYANLTGTDLAHANLTGTNLAHANLHGTSLTGTYLTGANLSGANLTRADLNRTVLAYANLRGANLTRADLTYAWLHRATLTTRQLLDTRGLRPGGHGLPRAAWDDLLPTNPEQRRLVEHFLAYSWGGTLREAIATVEGLTGR